MRKQVLADMPKRKAGEQEALLILKSMGIEIDEEYYDDNSKSSMPDLRYKDGRGIEVTHTRHNNAIVKGINNYNKVKQGEDSAAWIKRHLDIELQCHDALERVNNYGYSRDKFGNLMPEAQEQYKNDLKLLKKHMGYDPSEFDFNKKYSEFNCDTPILFFSVDNILREINVDKGRKYFDGNTDLFVFAVEDEYRLMKDLIPQKNWNGTAVSFLNALLRSPFPTIYVCAWNFEKQEYNTEHPNIIKFYKYKEGLKWIEGISQSL